MKDLRYEVMASASAGRQPHPSFRSGQRRLDPGRYPELRGRRLAGLGLQQENMANGSVSAQKQGVLVSCLYVSSATSIFSDEQLVTFLQSWRDRNSKHEITGFLLYHQGNFMQVIEGPADEISILLKAIEDDTRHMGMILLWRKDILEREFSEWCMGFRKGADLSPEDQETFSELLQDPNQDENFRDHPGPAHKMLVQFKKVCLRQ